MKDQELKKFCHGPNVQKMQMPGAKPRQFAKKDLSKFRCPITRSIGLKFVLTFRPVDEINRPGVIEGVDNKRAVHPIRELHKNRKFDFFFHGLKFSI
jgi:hypothetical protein